MGHRARHARPAQAPSTGTCPAATGLRAQGRSQARTHAPPGTGSPPPVPCTSLVLLTPPPRPPVPSRGQRLGKGSRSLPPSWLTASGPRGAWASGCPAGSAHPCGPRSPPGGPPSRRGARAGRSWRPGAGHPGTSGSAAGESGVSSRARGAAGGGGGRSVGPLTMQAACSASLSPAALGSHQTMWQRKAPGALAMMKAKERTSRPTPMKDRNRTRHSHSTTSVCGHAAGGHRCPRQDGGGDGAGGPDPPAHG